MGSSPGDDGTTLRGVAPDTRPDEDSEDNELPLSLQERGTFGRFTILDTLGAGGMGVVLAAYDPQLDRKVAIKVLRTRRLSGARREKEAARLLREARAMAQLSHPHVATIYDAGTIDDRVFIAMEYISGQTLRQWLAEAKRSVADILDVFVKAGRGLAAGHHAGLIHRDFKPENVLIGFDGRVRVIDFGLAQPARAQSDDDEGQRSANSDPMSFSTTAAGLFGTPLYMAPEQHEKKELDARTDQFAFCVALFEALYGRPPFPAQTYFELTAAVLTGKIVMPDAKPDIPPRVVDAVLRGLRTNPTDRFPVMDALLDDLEPPPVRKRRGLGVASLTLVVCGAVAITLVVMRVVGGAGDPCSGGDARLDSVWDVATKQRVKDAFLASHRSHAPYTVERVTAGLDKYAEAWLESRRKVCEATKVRKEQSDAAFDLRMQCLGRQLAELQALTALFSHSDLATIDNAVAATTALPRPEDCVTLAPGATPLTPMQRGALGVLENELGQVRANILAQRFAVATDIAKQLVVRAQPVAYPEFDADARYWLGLAQSGASKPVEAERTLRDALLDAARAKDDHLTAQIWATLIYVVGHQQARYADAMALQPIAEIAIKRVDDETALRSNLAYQIGVVHFTKGEIKLATESFELALRLLGPSSADTVETAHLLNALGGAYLRGGNVLGAKGAFERALAIIDKTLGPSHPEIAMPLANLGALAQALGNFDEATKYQQRALKILEELHGPEDVNVGLTVYGLGVSANGREDYKGAIPYYERALAIFEKIGPDHPYVGLALVGLADCREEVGDAARAVPEAERGLKLVEGSDQVQIALARYVLAKALWSANQERPRARALASEARKGFAAGGVTALNGLIAVDQWFKKIGAKP